MADDLLGVQDWQGTGFRGAEQVAATDDVVRGRGGAELVGTAGITLLSGSHRTRYGDRRMANGRFDPCTARVPLEDGVVAARRPFAKGDCAGV